MIDEATNRSLTMTFSVAQTPEEAFQAITNVRGWWSGTIEGSTDTLGGEFTFRYEDLHYSKQRVTELVPGKKVVWLVTDSTLNFIEAKHEWTGTQVVFEIARKGDKTEVRFTHAGLLPEHQCYGACSRGWSTFINGSLRNLIASGKGQPSIKEKTSAQIERLA